MTEKQCRLALERVYNCLAGKSFNHSQAVLAGRIDRALRIIDRTLHPESQIKLAKTKTGYVFGEYVITRDVVPGYKDGSTTFFDLRGPDGKTERYRSLNDVRDAISSKILDPLPPKPKEKDHEQHADTPRESEPARLCGSDVRRDS